MYPRIFFQDCMIKQKIRLCEQGLSGKDGETGPSGPSGPAVSIDVHLHGERWFFLQSDKFKVLLGS